MTIPRVYFDGETVMGDQPITTESLKNQLAHHTGSEHQFSFKNTDMVMSVGAGDFFRITDTPEILKLILSDIYPRYKTEQMVIIKFTVANKLLRIILENGDYRKFPYFKMLPCTAIPDGEWILWLMNKTLFLPSEY